MKNTFQKTIFQIFAHCTFTISASLHIHLNYHHCGVTLNTLSSFLLKYCIKCWSSNKRHPLISTAPLHTHIRIKCRPLIRESSNKHRNSRCGACQKSDHNVIVTKLKCLWNKHAKNEIIEINCSSGIYKAKYHNCSFYSYLKRESDKFLKFPMKFFSCFEIRASIF